MKLSKNRALALLLTLSMLLTLSGVSVFAQKEQNTYDSQGEWNDEQPVQLLVVDSGPARIEICGVAELEVGSVGKFTLAFFPTLPQPPVGNTLWSSSESAVATVASDGTVSAIAPGTAVISAQWSGQSGTPLEDTYTLTIKEKALVYASSVALSSSSLSMLAGGEEQLQLAFLPQGSLPVPVVWSSSNPNVASVSQGGRILAKNGGTTVVAASLQNGASALCSVTVQATTPETVAQIMEKVWNNIQLAQGQSDPAQKRALLQEADRWVKSLPESALRPAEYKKIVQELRRQLQQLVVTIPVASAKAQAAGIAPWNILVQGTEGLGNPDNLWLPSGALGSDGKPVTAAEAGIAVSVLNLCVDANDYLPAPLPSNVEVAGTKALALEVSFLVDGVLTPEPGRILRLTMPVPHGVEERDLVLLHYRSGSLRPQYLYPQVKNHTMTFKLERFGTLVAANYAPRAHSTNEKSTQQQDDYAYWADVIDQIEAYENYYDGFIVDDREVFAKAEDRKTVPATVLEALYGKNLSLRIDYGKYYDILIYGKKMDKVPENRISYTMSELLSRYREGLNLREEETTLPTPAPTPKPPLKGQLTPYVPKPVQAAPPSPPPVAPPVPKEEAKVPALEPAEEPTSTKEAPTIAPPTLQKQDWKTSPIWMPLAFASVGTLLAVLVGFAVYALRKRKANKAEETKNDVEEQKPMR